MTEDQSHEARRRAFIREHHPDRGGDPGAFIAGLRALDAAREPCSGPLPEVAVVRRRPWLARKATAVIRRLRHGPRPSRVHLPVTACPLLAVLVAAGSVSPRSRASTRCGGGAGERGAAGLCGAGHRVRALQPAGTRTNDLQLLRMESRAASLAPDLDVLRAVHSSSSATSSGTQVTLPVHGTFCSSGARARMTAAAVAGSAA